LAIRGTRSFFWGYQGKGEPEALIQASEDAQGVVTVNLDCEMHETKGEGGDPEWIFRACRVGRVCCGHVGVA